MNKRPQWKGITSIGNARDGIHLGGDIVPNMDDVLVRDNGRDGIHLSPAAMASTLGLPPDEFVALVRDLSQVPERDRVEEAKRHPTWKRWLKHGLLVGDIAMLALKALRACAGDPTALSPG